MLCVASLQINMECLNQLTGSRYLSCLDSTHHTLASCTHSQSAHLEGEWGWWKSPDILTPFRLRCLTFLTSSWFYIPPISSSLKALSVIFCNTPVLPKWKIVRSSDRTSSLLLFMNKLNLICWQCYGPLQVWLNFPCQTLNLPFLYGWSPFRSADYGMKLNDSAFQPFKDRMYPYTSSKDQNISWGRGFCTPRPERCKI